MTDRFEYGPGCNTVYLGYVRISIVATRESFIVPESLLSDNAAWQDFLHHYTEEQAA